jgi:sulfane dehydrogenase subunit SoxC
LVGLAAARVTPVSGEGDVKPETIHVTGNRPLGEISPYVKLQRNGTLTQGATPLQDSQGIITPSWLHYYVNHERGDLMNIDPQQHRLMIHGLVDRPLVLTMDEIRRLPSVSRVYFLECNANSNPRSIAQAKTVQQSHGLTSCSEWTGVPLSLFMKEVGVKKGADWVLAASADPSGHASTIPMEKVMDDALIAYYQNGEPLRLEQGYPLRLILPGWGGRLHIKWLNRLKVIDQPYMTTQDRSSQMDYSPVGEGAFLIAGEKARAWQYETYAKSVITFPSGGHKLTGRGFYEITGLAWSGSSKVKRVEVSTDGGKTWKDADLQQPIFTKAHTRFRFAWNWSGGEAVLQSRCTDEAGNVQPSTDETSKNWNSDNSEACVSVLGEDCKKIPRRADRAYIQSWRVLADGTVANAFVAPPPLFTGRSMHSNPEDNAPDGHEH